MLVVWIFLSIRGISAIHEYELKLITHKDTGNCKLCDKIDCTTVSKPSCAYYNEVNDIFGNSDNNEPGDNELNEDIEQMILQYIDSASVVSYEECIPFISQYTNCNKDNAYAECETCSCDVTGRWNCTLQRCPRDDHLTINHRILSVVMQKIQDYKKYNLNKRSKRSVNEINYDSKKISYEDILNWIYGVESFKMKGNKKSSEISDVDYKININKETFTKQPSVHTESDFLDFNALLNSINEDRENNIDQDNNNSKSLSFNSNYPLSFDIIKEIDKFDLTELNDSNISNDGMENVTPANNNASNKVNFEKNAAIIFDINNDNKKNRTLKKRDAPTETNATLTSVDYNNTINKMEDLHKSVIFALNTILVEKENELEKLTNMKDNLILYLESFGNISVSNDFILSNVTNNTKETYSNVYLYKFEEIPKQDLRKRDPNILEKYLKKLKQDIYQVTKDVAVIQRLSNTSIPQDLKVLIRAMRYYVMNENKRKKVNFRRDYDFNYTNKANEPLDIVINMIKVLDSRASTKDVLEDIFPGTRKIINRIIQTFYLESFSTGSPRPFDPQNNVLNTLKSIENKWQSISLTIGQTPIHERLFSLKYLHTVLSKDICKLNGILKSLDFVNSRRMALVGEVLEEKMIHKIATNIKQIYKIIDQIITEPRSEHLNAKNYTDVFKPKNESTIKKKSLFQRIKKMLKTSKKEIQNLFHKNITKSDIVKHIARKKMDEISKKKMSEYEEVMLRWQNNLNIVTVRKKRSPREIQQFMNKIKHIIPGYLRGKVKPAIDKKRNKTKLTTRKSKNRGRGKKKSASTTPKMKLSKNQKHNQTKHGH